MSLITSPVRIRTAIFAMGGYGLAQNKSEDALTA